MDERFVGQPLNKQELEIISQSQVFPMIQTMVLFSLAQREFLYTLFHWKTSATLYGTEPICAYLYVGTFSIKKLYRHLRKAFYWK